LCKLGIKHRSLTGLFFLGFGDGDTIRDGAADGFGCVHYCCWSVPTVNDNFSANAHAGQPTGKII
jgi:hypothetical protein